MSFEYLQHAPTERFRVPDNTDPLMAAIALLAFAAYPTASMIRERQEATDALHAWTIRQFIDAGFEMKPPANLARRCLPPATMRRRVYTLSRKIEDEALDLVSLGMDICFWRGETPDVVAGMLGKAFGAQVILKDKADRQSDTAFLKQHLRARKSKRALMETELDTIKNFKKRVWRRYLPALPLLTALHVDVLKYDPFNNKYGVDVPGLSRRYLAISLLHNPQLWVPTVVSHTAIRRHFMSLHFPKHTFAEVEGEGVSFFDPSRIS